MTMNTFSADAFIEAWRRMRQECRTDEMFHCAEDEEVYVSDMSDCTSMELVLNRFRSHGDRPGPYYFAGKVATNLCGSPTEREVQGDLFVESDIFFHHGDLHILGNVECSEGGLIVVTGNVLVSGCYSDYEPHFGLFVGGRFEADRITTMGQIVVSEDLSAKDIIFCHRNDYSLYVGGAVRCKCFVCYDHRVVAKAGVIADTHLDLENDPARVSLRNMFGDAAFEEDDDELIVEGDILHDQIKAQSGPYYSSTPD